MFKIPWPTWRFARVSRVDVAIDFYGISLTDWVWDRKGNRSRELICREYELRTLHLGAKRGSPLVIYNKAKQAPALAAGGPLTRVEFRIKYSQEVTGLIDLPSPLDKVVVLSPKKLPYPDPHRTALLSVGHLSGRRGILRTFPPRRSAKSGFGAREQQGTVVGPGRNLGQLDD